MYLFPHAYPNEMLQLVISLLALIVNVWGLWDAIAGYRLLLKEGINGMRKVVAFTFLFQESMLFSLQIIFVTIGIMGVVFPPPGLPEIVSLNIIQRIRAYRYLYLTGSLILAASTLQARYARHRLRIMWLAEKDRRRKNVGPPPFTSDRRRDVH